MSRHDFTHGPDEYTIQVADKPTGTPPRRGVTVFRRGGAQPVGKAFLFAGDPPRVAVQHLSGCDKGTLTAGLIESGALPKPPPPKPVRVPTRPAAGDQGETAPETPKAKRRASKE